MSACTTVLYALNNHCCVVPKHAVKLIMFKNMCHKVPVPVIVQPMLAPTGLSGFAEVFPVPTYRDIRLHTVGAFETAKVASLCHK